MKVHLIAVAMLAVFGASAAPQVLAESGSLSELPTLGESSEIMDDGDAQFTAGGKFQRLVQLPAGDRSVIYRHQLDLPPGVRVLAGSDEAGKSELASDLEVVDARGRTLGFIDAAWAQDASGRSLPSRFRIEGNALIQVVDLSEALGDITAVLQYTGIAAASADDGGTPAKAYVGIPSNYVYNLNHPRKTLHDYCTKSPDEFPNPVGANANFRGPCARHDMCFEQRQASQFTCNNRLWSNLVSNCEHTYAWYNPVRQSCINTAHVYWIAVTANTLWPW